MPKNSGAGIVTAAFYLWLFGFAMIPGILRWLAIVVLRRHDHQLDCKSFDEDVDYYVPVPEVEKLENQHFDEITTYRLKMATDTLTHATAHAQ